jgi:mono/diheme cytochrome c family protein
MLKKWLIFVFIVLVAGCSQPSLPSSEEVVTKPPLNPTTPPITNESSDLPETIKTPEVTTTINAEISDGTETYTFDLNDVNLTEFQGDSLPVDRGNFTSGSGGCAICHTSLKDGSGQDVSIDSYWRSTMMANAARDPYWLAAVRAETLTFPDLAEVIEEKCATCHMPLAKFESTAGSMQSLIFGEGLINPGHELHNLALDGVSCTLCHQILPDNFGTPESFSGGYLIDETTEMGERITYGPFPVGKQLANLMQSTSGFIPVMSPHIEESDLCATCHTLYTPYLDNEGKIVGEFPEQTVYFEWLNSEYATVQSCQSCHMPAADGKVNTSNIGGSPKEPFMQHSFVGGNAYGIQILGQFHDELRVTASSEQFNNTLTRIVDQIGNRTARVSIEDPQLSDSQFSVNVLIENQVGHKFPAGFPSRRAWLHFVVFDAKGNLIFESGGFDQFGFIFENDNDNDPTQFEPHYEVINSPVQVQIYEGIIHDVDDSVTTTLLRGAGYLKDNRLLPRGINIGEMPEDIEVRGAASHDTNFLGGSDKVRYVVDVSDIELPLTVNVELLYQSIGYRWAQNLDEYNAAEPNRFREYYRSVPNLPLVVGEVEVVFEDQP